MIDPFIFQLTVLTLLGYTLAFAVGAASEDNWLLAFMCVLGPTVSFVWLGAEMWKLAG